MMSKKMQRTMHCDFLSRLDTLTMLCCAFLRGHSNIKGSFCGRGCNIVYDSNNITDVLFLARKLENQVDRMIPTTGIISCISALRTKMIAMKRRKVVFLC